MPERTCIRCGRRHTYISGADTWYCGRCVKIISDIHAAVVNNHAKGN